MATGGTTSSAPFYSNLKVESPCTCYGTNKKHNVLNVTIIVSSSYLPFMPTLTRARLPPLRSFSTYVLKLTRRLLRPLRTRAFTLTTSRNPLPLLRMSYVALRHPFPLYCACPSENPFLTKLLSHLPLTSNEAANGSTRVVVVVVAARASVLPIITVTHPPTSSI